MLGGLEISVISYQKAIGEDATGRIDSSFFEKRFIELRRMAVAWDRLDAHAHSVVCGPFGSNLLNDNYVEQGIPMVRPFNLRNGRIDAGEVALVEEAFIEKAGLKTFDRGTLMFARVGDVGVGISLGEKVTISPNIIAAELDGSIDPYFVGVFANTRFGQLQLEAGMKVVAQPTISTEAIRALRIPQLGAVFQRRISDLFHLAVDAQDVGKRLLVDAETTLLGALGLENWQAPEPLSYVRSSRDAFAAGRLDAQHFQPRYAALTGYIQATGSGHLLGNWLHQNQRGKQPDYNDDGLPVVNSKHVLRGEVRLDSDNRRAMYSDDDLLIHTGDVLMNGTGVGTIGRCAPYLHAASAVPDNHVTILSPKSGLDAVYLSVFLNSMAGQLQVEQRLRGSSGQIELYPNDIAQFNIWIAPLSVQRDVRHAVEQSFKQKQRSTHLLNTAKRAVEIAIEQDEKTALAYLEANA